MDLSQREAGCTALHMSMSSHCNFSVLFTSYCSKFPSSGVGAPVIVCRRKELWSDDEVEFVSVVNLPRNSPVYQPIKV